MSRAPAIGSRPASDRIPSERPSRYDSAQTPADANFKGEFQRCGGKPLIRDVHGINIHLKWIKRMPCKTKYSKLIPPVCLCCIADSAYRADDEDCLALRACIVVLIEIRNDFPKGRMHVLDFYSRKQTRVNRGTFGAELNNALGFRVRHDVSRCHVRKHVWSL